MDSEKFDQVQDWLLGNKRDSRQWPVEDEALLWRLRTLHSEWTWRQVQTKFNDANPKGGSRTMDSVSTKFRAIKDRKEKTDRTSHNMQSQVVYSAHKPTLADVLLQDYLRRRRRVGALGFAWLYAGRGWMVKSYHSVGGDASC